MVSPEPKPTEPKDGVPGTQESQDGVPGTHVPGTQES